MTKTAVVILNYNGAKFLKQFLPSVIQHSVEADIIVADNGSTDESILLLKQEFPIIKVISLNRNYGFCGGYNRALSQIEATYFVLLNSDVEVTSNWLTPMINLLERNNSIAAVQPKILSYYNKDSFEYAGAGGGFIDALGYPFCRGRLFDELEKDAGQYNDERQIFWATGACFVIRSEVFHHFNGFDEDFFAHMEEIDLCWKINRTPQCVYYCGGSTVYHVGAGTLGYGSPMKIYLNFRNGLSLLIKHLDPLELTYKIPIRIAFDWLATFVYLLKGQFKNSLAVVHAHAYLLANLKKTIIKRRNIRNQYATYARSGVYPGLIVVYKFLKRKSTINNPR